MLPKGWAKADFEEIFDFKGGSQPPKSDFSSEKKHNYVRLLQIRDFESDEKAVYIKDLSKWPKCSAEDIMIGRYGASVGKILSGKAGAYNVALVKMIFDSNKIDRKWVRKFLESTHFQEPLKEISRSAQNGFNKNDIKKIHVLLPPLAEQRRIVAKLDSLTARIARARAELERIEKLIPVLRDNALETTFNGDLSIVSKSGLAAWVTKPFDEVGKIASNLVPPEEIQDLPHIAPNHIRSGIPGVDGFRTISEDKVISAKNRFFSGQIIYSKIRPNLRKIALVDFEGGCSADMYPINAYCNAKYLMYWMLSPQFTDMATKSDGRTVLPKINQKALNAIPTPLAPIELQKAIALTLDGVFERSKRFETETQRALTLLNRLESSLLAKAFRGELVPQDPNDEPASVLLDRIRAERAAAPKPGRKRKA